MKISGLKNIYVWNYKAIIILEFDDTVFCVFFYHFLVVFSSVYIKNDLFYNTNLTKFATGKNVWIG